MELYRRWKGGQLVEEIRTHHLMLDEQRVCMVEEVVKTDNPNLVKAILYRYQYSNHLGSVGLELDSKADVISYEEYHPYGTLAYQAKNKNIKATAKRYRYTGMERDEESGFSYHSARYYLPWLGRWLSADPIGIGDGVNVYAYCRGSPIQKNDIKGSSSKDTQESNKLLIPNSKEFQVSKDSTHQEISEFVKNNGFYLLNPNRTNDKYVESNNSGYWDLGEDSELINMTTDIEEIDMRKNNFSIVDIDAIGFNLEWSVGGSKILGIKGIEGISVTWFSDGDDASFLPHIYLYDGFGLSAGLQVGISSSFSFSPFYADYKGSDSQITKESWKGKFVSLGANISGGPLLTAEIGVSRFMSGNNSLLDPVAYNQWDGTAGVISLGVGVEASMALEVTSTNYIYIGSLGDLISNKDSRKDFKSKERKRNAK